MSDSEVTGCDFYYGLSWFVGACGILFSFGGGYHMMTCREKTYYFSAVTWAEVTTGWLEIMCNGIGAFAIGIALFLVAIVLRWWLK